MGRDSSIDDRTRYVGLRNIATRIDCTVSQLRTLYDRDFFPMFKLPNFRSFPGKPMRKIGPPQVWVTEEWIVRWWMLVKLKKDLEVRRARGRTA